MCVYIHVCILMSVYRQAFHGSHLKVKGQPHLPPWLILFSPVYTRLAHGLRGILLPLAPISQWEYRDSRDLNLGPHTSVAGTYLTFKLSPRSFIIFSSYGDYNSICGTFMPCSVYAQGSPETHAGLVTPVKSNLQEA